MSCTINFLPSATPLNSRAIFARSAVFEAFGRHAQALDFNDFIDRPPDQAPRLICTPRRALRLPSLRRRYGQ